MDLACVRQGLHEIAAQHAAFERDDLVGLLLIGVLCAVVLAPVVLVLYQRRVDHLMQRRASSRTGAEVEHPNSGGGDVREWSDVSPEVLIGAADARARALWRALALSVALFSVGVALAITASPDAPGELALRPWWQWTVDAIGYQIFVGSLCAPLVLLGVASSRFAGLFWTRCAPVYVAVAAVAILLDENPPDGGRLESFAGGLVFLVILYAGLGGRRMRNVVPMLALLICLLVVAVVVLAASVTMVESCTDQDFIVMLLFTCVLILAALAAGWRTVLSALGSLTRAYERKAFSEAQLQVGAWLAVITTLFLLTPGHVDVGLNLWSLGVVPPLAAGLWLYGTLLHRIEPWRAPRALLLLRVFRRDRRGERLLDEVAFRWRFIGPIHMISGPDLARTNLDPHELLLFLRRRLGDIFVADRAGLARGLAELDVRPDPDARYRINEFFCFDDVWAEAVGALVPRADAILLDLRGFTRARRGAAFEITLLAERDALRHTVILVDGHTDMAAVHQAIAEVPGAGLPEEHVLRSDGAVAGDALFRRLVAAARGSRRPGQPAPG